MISSQPRVVWFAATRSETLQLGPLFNRLGRDPAVRDFHSFAFLAEHGLPAEQALDSLGIHPHDRFEVRSPDEDPGIRLGELLGDVERITRRRRATHILTAGFGPTAAAASLVAHSRLCRGLWIRPRDPAGLNELRPWERGLERFVRANEGMRILEPDVSGIACEAAPVAPPLDLISGLRPGAPLVLVALTRWHWGVYSGHPAILRGLFGLAAAMPESDFVLIRTLDPRFEGPLRALSGGETNLHSTLPLPPGDYRRLLAASVGVITDSPLIAAEARRPVLFIAETAPNTPSAGGTSDPLIVRPDALASPDAEAFVRKMVPCENPRPAPGDPFEPSEELVRSVAAWFTGS